MTARLLYVITDLHVGGVPLHLHRLAAAMRRRGFGVMVVSLADPPGAVAERLRDEGVDVRTCGGRGGWDVRVLGRLTRLLKADPPDLVHSFLFHANLAARWAARRTGFPIARLIGEIQTVEVERRWHLWVDRRTHSLSRFTIGNSPSVIRHLAEKARIPREKLRLVRGGTDVERIRRAKPADRDELRVPRDRPLVLWVGRLDPSKGLLQLVRATAGLVERHPAFLLLVGDGPLREELQRLIVACRLSEHVRLAGARSDVPEILKIADLFVFPSRTEGLPNALLEAMAAGLPIAATDVPGCRDLIAHERTGLLTPYGDIDALGRAMARLLSQPSLARRLGETAAAEAASRWTLEQSLDGYAALYTEALSSGPATERPSGVHVG